MLNLYVQQFLSCVKDGITIPAITNTKLSPYCKIACRSCKHSNNANFWCTEDHYLHRVNEHHLQDPKVITLLFTKYPEYFL